MRQFSSNFKLLIKSIFNVYCGNKYSNKDLRNLKFELDKYFPNWDREKLDKIFLIDSNHDALLVLIRICRNLGVKKKLKKNKVGSYLKKIAGDLNRGIN